MVELGDEVKDTVTGFIGIVVARHQYLYGCTRISVQPPVDKDGKVPDSHGFDEPQLEILKPKKTPVATPEERWVGGPFHTLPQAKIMDTRKNMT